MADAHRLWIMHRTKSAKAAGTEKEVSDRGGEKQLQGQCNSVTFTPQSISRQSSFNQMDWQTSRLSENTHKHTHTLAVQFLSLQGNFHRLTIIFWKLSLDLTWKQVSIQSLQGLFVSIPFLGPHDVTVKTWAIQVHTHAYSQTHISTPKSTWHMLHNVTFCPLEVWIPLHCCALTQHSPAVSNNIMAFRLIFFPTWLIELMSVLIQLE